MTILLRASVRSSFVIPKELFLTCTRLERQSFEVKFCGGQKWNYFPQQGRRYAPSSSLLIFDVYDPSLATILYTDLLNKLI